MFHDYDEKSKTLYCHALQKAKQVASILKNRYCAERVILFGSLLYSEKFNAHSVIDLAVSGVPDHKFYKAVGAITLDAAPYELDLVDLDDCKRVAKTGNEAEGMEI